MIIETDFVNHWKTKALAAAIGKAEALQALLLLWGHCQTRKAWEFQLTPLMLAGICGYEGEAEKLSKVMLELRWIVPADELGWFQVRGWGEVNASLVGKWAGGLRKQGATWHPRGYGIDPTKGATIGSTTGRPQDTTGATLGSSNGATSDSSTGTTDLIGLDGIREEAKSTPKAPKGGGASLPMPADWSPRRVEIMQRWLDYRTASRKTVRAPSWPALQTKVAVLDDEQLDACVSDSIANGWMGLFPERFTLSPPTGGGTGAANAQKKEGAAPPPAKKIRPPDFPWRVVAIDHEGWTPDGEWEDQTPRTRRSLQDSWAALAPQTKAALWTLAQDGRKEPEDSAEGFACPTPCDWREVWAEIYHGLPSPDTWAGVSDLARREIVAAIEAKKKKGAAAE
ncbi:hypothetical protein [Prosthecobacter sp.]|uniref:hypothetical protein n=1 Tax=Prosthecobacter sp. TaxID=1965333 RepID=UPI0037831D01